MRSSSPRRLACAARPQLRGGDLHPRGRAAHRPRRTGLAPRRRRLHADDDRDPPRPEQSVRRLGALPVAQFTAQAGPCTRAGETPSSSPPRTSWPCAQRPDGRRSAIRPCGYVGHYLGTGPQLETLADPRPRSRYGRPPGWTPRSSPTAGSRVKMLVDRDFGRGPRDDVHGRLRARRAPRRRTTTHSRRPTSSSPARSRPSSTASASTLRPGDVVVRPGRFRPWLLQHRGRSESAGSRPRRRNLRPAMPIAGWPAGNATRDRAEGDRTMSSRWSGRRRRRNPGHRAGDWSATTIEAGARWSSPVVTPTTSSWPSRSSAAGRAGSASTWPNRTTIASALAGGRAGPAAGARGHRSRPEHRRRLRPRPGHPPGDAQARRVHRGRPPAPDRLTDDASVLLFGGMAKERPYPGSTTVTTVNGGVVGLTRTLVEELKPLAGELDPPRASSATARTGQRSRRPSRSTRRRRRSADWRRWTRSSMRPSSCSRTPPSTGSS